MRFSPALIAAGLATFLTHGGAAATEFGLSWSGVFEGSITPADTSTPVPARLSLSFDGTSIAGTLESAVDLGGAGGAAAMSGYTENGRCVVKGDIGNGRSVELYGPCSPAGYTGDFGTSGRGGFQRGGFAFVPAGGSAAAAAPLPLPLPRGALGCWFHDVASAADPLTWGRSRFEPSAMVSLVLHGDGSYVAGVAPDDRTGRFTHDGAANAVTLVGGPFDGAFGHVEIGSGGSTKLVFYRDENEGEVLVEESATSFERRRFRIDPGTTTCSRRAG